MIATRRTMQTSVTFFENRASQFKRALFSWFIDTDGYTVEKGFITAQIILSIAVLVLNERLIVVPPPLTALILPAPCWFVLLLGLAGVHIWGFNNISPKVRHYCPLASGLVLGALCYPLFLRAPTVLVGVLPLALGFGFIAARIHSDFKNAD